MLHAFLKKLFAHKDLGWKEIGEEFTRFFLVKTSLFQVLLHRLDAPKWHPQCHDHPWDFVTVILKGGYLERTYAGDVWRSAGTVLYRPAEFSHNVITDGVCWSLLVTGAKTREWQFTEVCNG